MVLLFDKTWCPHLSFKQLDSYTPPPINVVISPITDVLLLLMVLMVRAIVDSYLGGIIGVQWPLAIINL